MPRAQIVELSAVVRAPYVRSGAPRGRKAAFEGPASPLSLQVPVSMRERLVALAKAQSTPFTTYVRNILNSHLGEVAPEVTEAVQAASIAATEVSTPDVSGEPAETAPETSGEMVDLLPAAPPEERPARRGKRR